MSAATRHPRREFDCNGKKHDITLQDNAKDWARRVLADFKNKNHLTVEMAKAALDIPSTFRRWDK